MSFVHLHVHDNHSMLEGMGTPADYVRLAKDFGHPALAMTNTGNLFNAHTFWKECKSAGIKPILGVEFYMSETDNMKSKDSKNQHRVVALAKNQAGWKNLMQLSTLAFMEGRYYKPRLDTAHLLERHEGLVILSGGLDGQIGARWKRGDETGALAMARRYREVFGDDFYLEVIPVDSYSQTELNQFLFSISSIDGFPIVVTNDVRFPTPDKAEFYEFLPQIQEGGRRIGSEPPPTKRYYRSRDEMREALLAQGFGEAVSDAWLDRTLKIAESIEPISFADDFKLPVFQDSDADVQVPQASAIGIGTDEEIAEDEDDEEGSLFDVK